MNISYKWLKEYVDFDLSAEQVASALTSIGLEVGSLEEVETIKGGLEGLVVGQILTCEPHPNSDHMHVTTVDLGSGEPVQIVCGAPNVAKGQKVIVATIGTKLYDGQECLTIKRSKLRGVESCGMICAEDEIGIGTDHSGIIVLEDDARVGTPAREYYHIESDWVIEVDITPNRSDACSHYGVARDLYAYLVENGYPTALRLPSVDAFSVDSHELEIGVEVENPQACPVYAGLTIKGVTVKESPEWLQNRLRTIGLRPINNIVDITNYILFSYGHPMHCFDADRIKGGKVIVRTLPDGTPFTTLDGVERKLSSGDLMICNREEPMCIAGVFGGLESGTTENTVNVFLESAYFHPTWIRKTARRHGLSTDSSFRYERGIDPNSTLYCLKAAALMVKELAGGTISSEIVSVQAREFPPFRVTLSLDRVDALVGKQIPRQTVLSILRSLEMEVLSERDRVLEIAVPQYRVDVQRECDVIEDILRIYGYNNVEIPSTLRSSLTVKGESDHSYHMQNLVSEQLVGAGFNEILSNSLTKASYYEDLQSCPSSGLVRLMNPLSQDLSVLRQTLLFGGLEAIARNSNRRNQDLRLFEVGNCYSYDGEKRNPEKPLACYQETAHLGLWLTGQRISGSWAHKAMESSAYELKGYLENILRRLGVSPHSLALENVQDDLFSSAVAYTARGGRRLAVLGVVSKAVLRRFDIEAQVYYADISWNDLMRQAKGCGVSFSELPKFPAVKRDLALLLDEKVNFSDVERVAFETERRILRSVTLFDVYEGKNLEPGKKSYAVSFTLQDDSATLQDKTIEKVMEKLTRNLQEKLGARLR